MMSQRVSSLAALWLAGCFDPRLPSRPRPTRRPPPPPSGAPSLPARAARRLRPRDLRRTSRRSSAPCRDEAEVVYAVEGAVAVSEDQRVGVIVDDGITWIARARAPPRAVLEDNVLFDVKGAIDMLREPSHERQ